jgi:hypothetical protein
MGHHRTCSGGSFSTALSLPSGPGVNLAAGYLRSDMRYSAEGGSSVKTLVPATTAYRFS